MNLSICFRYETEMKIEQFEIDIFNDNYSVNHHFTNTI